MADQINDYRKGLSQIHKSGDGDPNGSIDPVECVFKFGGSSLANAERIEHVANLIKSQIEEGYKIIEEAGGLRAYDARVREALASKMEEEATA